MPWIAIGRHTKTAASASENLFQFSVKEQYITVTYPPVIACRKLALNVAFKDNLEDDCGRICKRNRVDSDASYALSKTLCQYKC